MPSMKIQLCSVMVNDQAKALRFYTEVLGFVPKEDIPMGEHRWITVVSPELPHGPELVLEPTAFPPAKTFQSELYSAKIPVTALAVDDVQAEYERLQALNVEFSMEPKEAGGVKLAVFDDTCGNWLQIYQV